MRPCVALLFAVSLLNSYEAQGSSAVTTVFVKKGDDLILNVDADVPEEFSFVEWKFNKIASVVRFPPKGERIIGPNFTVRLEFPVKKFSVKLKNLQEADSGVYTALVVTVREGVQARVEYKVTVQGPVSPVELTVDSVFSRSSCNLTVTCSTQHSHINSTFRCVSGTCSPEGGKRSELTTSGASLHVYLLNGAIICNHSNHVNWTKDFNTTEHFCPQYADGIHNPDAVITVAVIITILIIVGVFVLFFYRRKRRNHIREIIESIENTVYEVPQPQPLEQSPTDDASDLSPTTYSLVGPHAGSVIPTQPLPESLYAQVEKPARSFNS